MFVGFRAAGFVSELFSFPFNFEAALDSFSHGSELKVRWRARSDELSKHSSHAGLHS